MRGHLRKRGKCWNIVIDIGYDDEGDRKQKWISVNKYLGVPNATKPDAERALTDILKEINSGTFIEPSNMTLKEYIETSWMPEFKARVSPYTFKRYNSIIQQRIIPWLGKYVMDKLKPTHIKNFLTKVASEGRKDGRDGNLSCGSIKYHKTVMSGILQTAVNDEILSRNVARKVALPVSNEAKILEKKRKTMAWTPEQVNIIEEHLTEAPFPYREAVFTALRGALRRGELLGLKWTDIEFEKHKITINQTLAYTPEKGVFIKKVAKNKESMNSIEVSEKVIDMLRNLQKKQAENKHLFGPEYEQREEFKHLVFCREDGRPIYPDSLTIWFPHFLKRLGLPHLNFHCLRHTCASLMVLGGASIEEVSRFLRHSDIGITQKKYWHLFPGQQKRAAEKLDNVLEEIKSRGAK